MIDAPLPGFTAAIAGPTNGPLTSSEFAAQSSDPQQAETQFNTLESQPGFGAFLRLWTDVHGPGLGANDIVDTLFRIPNSSTAETMFAGFYRPYDQAPNASGFAVPSIPGAVGYTLSMASPAPVREQIVIFRSGQYVAIVQLASSTAAANPSPLTPSDAIAVGYRQLVAVRHASQIAATGPHPPGTMSHPDGGGSMEIALAAIGSVIVVAAIVWLIGPRRSRRRPIPSAPTALDPWGPGGIFDTMGAIAPDRPIDPSPVSATTEHPTDREHPGASATPVGRLDEPAPGTPASWLPDPSGSPDLIRYWDGLAWTSHLAERENGR
jgi:Protein of unknown function (DUF2510)